MTLLIRCTYIDASKDVIYGEDQDPQEVFTDDIGKLFRDCQREYGACASKVYVDSKSCGTQAVGWVFRRREEYGDASRIRNKAARTFLREVWVYLYETCEPSDPRSYQRKTPYGAVPACFRDYHLGASKRAA